MWVLQIKWGVTKYNAHKIEVLQDVYKVEYSVPVQLPVYLVWPHVCLDRFENDALVGFSLQMEHCHQCEYN